MRLRSSLRLSNALRRAQGRLTWKERLLGLILVGVTFIGTGALLVGASALLNLKLSPLRLFTLYIGLLFTILPTLRPWWFWHWDQMEFWRDLLGDRGARFFLIALGLLALFLGLAPGRWLP